MSVAEVNGSPVISGKVRLQRVGLWVADLAVDQRSAVSGSVSLTIDGGELELKGTAARTGTFLDTAVLRVVAGAGGMAQAVPAKFYRQIAARQVFEDILRAGGEKLAASSSRSALDHQLRAYCQIAEPVGDALAGLCDYLGVIWRALPDGSIWVGVESWPDAADPGESIAEDPHTMTETWGVEAPALLPGSKVKGRKVSAVEHQIEPDALRTVVHYDRDDAADNSEDRQTRATRALVQRFLAPLLFQGVLRAKVVKQNSDLSLELTPDEAVWPGLTKVPVRWGVAGATSKLKSPISARALVAFEDADPGRPVVIGWESADVDTTTIPGDSVLLGDSGDRTANKALALAELVEARLNSIQSTFDGHTHGGSSLTANTQTGAVTGNTLVPNSTIGSLDPVGSQVAKAKS